MRRPSMPTYVTLFRWTQLGIENVKLSPTRLDAARELFRQMGGELKSFHIVMGQYDAIAVAEAPDDERSEEHTSELQSQSNLVCRLLLEKKKRITKRLT